MANPNDKQLDKDSTSKDSEPIISKSDIQDIKNILKSIDRAAQESAGFSKSLYDEKGSKDISKGTTHHKIYESYYDVSHTITTAGPVNPNDFDSNVYNVERIFEATERYADIVEVINDSTEQLFVIISHGGRTNFSQEANIFPGESKQYFNVYELRLRSPLLGAPYRITEYDIMGISQTSLIPIELANLHDVPLPVAGANWLAIDLVPIRFPTTFRIQVAVSIAGTLSATITQGGDTQVVILNILSGPALVADGLYEFEILVHQGDSINFIYSVTGGVIRILRVQEIDSATA